MTALALGVLEDLKARKLLPVAALLVLALAAVPLLMLEPAEEPPALPAAAVSPAASTGGLPGPAEALAGRPLVRLAVLDRPSDLDSFEIKNPFKPLEELDPMSADTLSEADVGAVEGDGGAGATVANAGGTGGDTGGGATPAVPAPNPDADPGPGPGPAPVPDPDPDPLEKFTYAVDVTLDGPGGALRYRNLPRLGMLPSLEAPLLVFLGVAVSGNEAVFLIDSKLTPQAGEGTCAPSPEACATVTLEPGERQIFTDAQGVTYTLTINQIREVPVAKARDDASGPTPIGGAVQSSGPVDRLVPLFLVDVLVSGQR